MNKIAENQILRHNRDIIENEKKSNHNQLAIKMQKLESEICIDIICQELDKEDIKYFTIHDAWLVDKLDEIKVKDIIEREFIKKYNSKPKIKVEKITK
jgi:NAD-dependent DNA ligase